MKLRLRIGVLMKQQGITVKELAEQANITQNTARMLYHGVNTRIDLPIMERVAKALGVMPLDLFEQVEDDST